jgi:hypothetical protein
MDEKKLWIHFVLGAFAYLILIWSYREVPFFWDTIQFAGKHGLWYFEQGLFSGYLPPELNSGHPPSFGIYQAALWKLLGKSLTISHFSLLPFLWLNLYYSLRLGRQILGQQGWLFAVAFAMCPFYLGHSILVSPDLILVTGFLMTLYGCLSHQKVSIIVGSLLLALISIRGQMMLGVLILFYLSITTEQTDLGQKVKSAMRLFGLGVGLAIIFHFLQHATTDWEGLEASPWAASFEYVSWRGWIRQLGIFGWRVLDYGMLVPVGIILLGLKSIWKAYPQLLLLSMLITLVLVIVLTPRVGLMNHRYFLPLQIIVLLMATWLISRQWKNGLKGKVLAALLLLSMVFGNRLIYPDTVAQGWDSTAAHWPIYGMEQEMYTYITERGLPLQTIGTAFPYRSDRGFATLNEARGGYKQFDLDTDQYILYSNIMNEFRDEDLLYLKKNYKVLKRIERAGLHLSLYQKG